MKKFYTFLFLTILALVGFKAAADEVYVYIDDASHIDRVEWEWSTVEDFHSGLNVFEMTEPYGSQLYLYLAEGYAHGTVKKVYTDNTEEEVSQWYPNYISLYCSPNDAGVSFYIETLSIDENRNATCTVNIDNVDAITSLQTSSFYQEIPLVNGSNPVKFWAEQESPLILNVPNQLYKVVLDGEEVAYDGYGRYDLYVNDGSTVDITTEWPDVKFPVTFSFVNEGTSDFIKSVTIDDQPVENWADGLEVQAGSKLEFFYDIANYRVNSFSVNDEDTYLSEWSDSYDTMIAGETNFTFDVSILAPYSITINVADASTVIVYPGYDDENLIDLIDGTNKIDLAATVSSIKIKPTSGSQIDGITIDDEPYTDGPGWDGSYQITTKDGMVINIESSKIVRDAKAVIYISDYEMAQDQENFYGFGVMRSDYSEVEVKTGHTVIEFNSETESVFQISLYNGCTYDDEYSTANCQLYLNDEIATTYYGNTATWELTLKDGDVLKAYIGLEHRTAADALHNVTFDLSGFGASAPTITRDVIVPVEDTFAALPSRWGTLIELESNDSATINEVKVNDEAVESDENGKYTVTVAGPTHIAMVGKPSGIGSIIANDHIANGKIYNLQGIEVRADLNNLPAGVYIIDGKKVVR